MGGSGSKTEEFGPASADYHLSIQYCGGWGYRSKAVDAQKHVTKEFGDKVHVILHRDSGVTGNFEITIEGAQKNGKKVIHSKKGGDGFVTKDNKDEFLRKVREFIES